jgi:transcriptional antiterminator RfaH
MSWTVLHVRPRCEKKMAEYCAFYDIEHYLPLRRETKIYQRRKVMVEKPVFPGYVFADVPENGRETVLKSNNIVRMIEVDDQLTFEREIGQIRMALDVDPTLGATEAFTQGKTVRIIEGSFRGLEGVVQAVKSEARVVLNVNLIGQAVAVDVDMDMLAPLD